MPTPIAVHAHCCPRPLLSTLIAPHRAPKTVSLWLARVCHRRAPPSRLASQQKSFSYREQFRSGEKSQDHDAETAHSSRKRPTLRRRGRYASTRDFVLHACLTVSFTAVMLGSRDRYGHAFRCETMRL